MQSVGRMTVRVPSMALLLTSIYKYNIHLLCILSAYVLAVLLTAVVLFTAFVLLILLTASILLTGLAIRLCITFINFVRMLISTVRTLFSL